MDGTSLVLGLAVGGALGAAAAAVYFLSGARGVAGRHAASEALVRAQLGAAQQGEAAARASLAVVQEQARDMRAQLEAERQRAAQEQAQHARTKQELRAAEERGAEREAASARVLAERERSILELRATLEQSKVALTESFKATGADVLKQAAETFLVQAREQFEGQQRLTQQALEARQQAMDAALTPLREQLLKSEQLVKELGEKREGDAKTLGEQLKQIADLQQRASSAAQALSSALRDNRQRGRWGEVSLRNIAELAGLVESVDFTEQASVEGEEGARLRPDMVVRLPGNRFVPVDAKVPMNAYLDSLDASLADGERAARRTAHAQALRAHVRALAGRDYAKVLGGGVEITVLFVPLESGLIAALEEDGTLYAEALEKNVVITTASTLLALLRTCALQWQQARLNENARSIGGSARELLERIWTFAEHLEKAGAGLSGAVRHYNQAVGSFNLRLVTGARATAELAGDAALAPGELEPLQAEVREVARRTLPGGGVG